MSLILLLLQLQNIDFLDTKKTNEETKDTTKLEKDPSKEDFTGPVESCFNQPNMSDLDCIPDEDLPF